MQVMQTYFVLKERILRQNNYPSILLKMFLDGWWFSKLQIRVASLISGIISIVQIQALLPHKAWNLK